MYWSVYNWLLWHIYRWYIVNDWIKILDKLVTSTPSGTTEQDFQQAQIKMMNAIIILTKQMEEVRRWTNPIKIQPNLRP